MWSSSPRIEPAWRIRSPAHRTGAVALAIVLNQEGLLPQRAKLMLLPIELAEQKSIPVMPPVLLMSVLGARGRSEAKHDGV